MTALIDLTGKMFGRLHVGTRAENRTCGKHVAWNCACSCGRTTVATTLHLRSGHTRSCGCLLAERLAAGGRKHGYVAANGRHGGAYQAWSSAKRRCYTQTCPDFADYGGRGITMHPRWRDDFAAFLRDMGERPRGMTLDRIHNNGNYEPGNCRWATLREQANNKRGNIWVNYRGQRMTLKQVARQHGVEYHSLYHFYRAQQLPLKFALVLARPAV